MDGLRAQAAHIPSLDWTARVGDARRVLSQHADAPAVALVSDEAPRALVSRARLQHRRLSALLRGPLAQLPARWLAEHDPVIVDVAIDTESLTRMLIVERPSALRDGFVLAEYGRYAGVGSGRMAFEALERETRERTAELERLYADAVSASRAKSAFLANMSHELRTPLNAIIGFSDIIRSETFGKIEPQQYAEYIDDVNGSGKHLLGVINAVLEMSRIEAGELTLDDAWIDIVDLIDGCLAMLRGKSQRLGLTLRLIVPAPVRLVRGDRMRCTQVVLNLLTNAIKFSRSGCAIDVRVAMDENGRLAVSVVDNGIGIPADRLNDVLLPFYQVESAHSRKNHGSGLGLPLAKALIEAHDGSFSITSKLGAGSTVTFTFPPHRLGEVARSRPAGDTPEPEFATPLSA